MSDLRKEFEEWCVKEDEFCIHRYAGDNDYSDDYTQCAWLAWQEQQKKIDAIKQHVVGFCAEADLWGFDSDQAIRQIDLIQELLK